MTSADWIPPPPPPLEDTTDTTNTSFPEQYQQYHQPQQQYNQYQNNAWSQPPQHSSSPHTQQQQLQPNTIQVTNRNYAYIQNRRSLNPRSISPTNNIILGNQNMINNKSTSPKRKINLFSSDFIQNKASINNVKKPIIQKFRLPDTGISEAEIFSKYIVGHGKIGAGAFSQIKKIIRKSDGKIFALKMVKKKGKSHADIRTFQKEITILSKIDHENIIRLYDFCDTKQGIYMVLELCEGGDVMERMNGLNCLSEQESKNITYQTLKGIKEFQKFQIVHRDLKLDNLMYATKDFETSVVKIIDFGLAGDLHYGPLQTQCGTLHYCAPEVVAGRGYYGIEADLWSIGVIAYMLLSGFPPFFDLHGNDQKLMSLIKKVKYEFGSPYFDEVSKSARDFISKCLVKLPALRIKVDDALNHEWFTGIAPLKSKSDPRRLSNSALLVSNFNNTGDVDQNQMKNQYFNQYYAEQKQKIDENVLGEQFGSEGQQKQQIQQFSGYDQNAYGNQYGQQQQSQNEYSSFPAPPGLNDMQYNQDGSMKGGNDAGGGYPPPPKRLENQQKY